MCSAASQNSREIWLIMNRLISLDEWASILLSSNRYKPVYICGLKTIGLENSGTVWAHEFLLGADQATADIVNGLSELLHWYSYPSIIVHNTVVLNVGEFRTSGWWFAWCLRSKRFIISLSDIISALAGVPGSNPWRGYRSDEPAFKCDSNDHLSRSKSLFKTKAGK